MAAVEDIRWMTQSILCTPLPTMPSLSQVPDATVARPTERIRHGRRRRELPAVASGRSTGDPGTSCPSTASPVVDYLGDEYDGDRRPPWLACPPDAGRAFDDPCPRPALHPAARRRRPHRFGQLERPPPGSPGGIDPRNRQDQVRPVPPFATPGRATSHCPPTPIGRWSGHLRMAADRPPAPRSDRICTGLQLAEHWQDVAEAGRRTGSPARPTIWPAWITARRPAADPPGAGGLRGLMAFQVARPDDISRRSAPDRLAPRPAGGPWPVSGPGGRPPSMPWPIAISTPSGERPGRPRGGWPSTWPVPSGARGPAGISS